MKLEVVGVVVLLAAVSHAALMKREASPEAEADAAPLISSQKSNRDGKIFAYHVIYRTTITTSTSTSTVSTFTFCFLEISIGANCLVSGKRRKRAAINEAPEAKIEEEEFIPYRVKENTALIGAPKRKGRWFYHTSHTTSTTTIMTTFTTYTETVQASIFSCNAAFVPPVSNCLG